MMNTASATPAVSATTQRIEELDALRGIAAMAVVLFHYTTRFDQMFGRVEPLAVEFPWGDRGVHLFFMLSGYVILMTLDRTKTVSDFVIGRFSRLYPAFWAAALLTFVVVRWAALPGQVVSFRDALLNLTMVPILLKAQLIDGAYWTLQAELLFYAAMLGLHRTGAFRRLATTLQLWLGLAAVAHLALWLGGSSPIVQSLVLKLQTLGSLRYLHLFAIGITFYDLRRHGITANHVVILAACLAITACVSPIVDTVLVTLLAALLFAAISGRLRWLAARPLVALGGISYTLYLVHENLGFVLLRWLETMGCEPHVAVLLTIFAAVGLATGVSIAIERPALRLIRAAMKRRAATAAFAEQPQSVPN